jgi:hypothetical protein
MLAFTDPTRQTGGVRNFIEQLWKMSSLNDFPEGMASRVRPHLITEFGPHVSTKT